MASRTEDDSEIEGLAERAATGDEAAWQRLWKLIEPRLLAFVRRRTFVGVTGREDDMRDVVVAVMARLREDDFRRLRGKPAGAAFMPWLIVVAKRVAIDCLRAHPDYVDRRRSARGDEAPGEWVAPVALAGEREISAGRPPMTNRVLARQILRYADGALDAAQRRALELWAEQRSVEEIVADLALEGPEEAERLVRSAVERLRRRFRERSAR